MLHSMTGPIVILALVFSCQVDAANKCPIGQTSVDVPVRVGAYNVMYGHLGDPEKIGELLRPFNLDVVGLSEVPGGDWTERLGKELGLHFSYVGSISSANHMDKYKSILSRTPIIAPGEIRLENGTGWRPASAVFGSIELRGIAFEFFTTHIAASKAREGQAYELLNKHLLPDQSRSIIVVGDFNNEIGDRAISEYLKNGFKSAWLEGGLNPQRLSTVSKPSKIGMIDHIFYLSEEDIEVTGAGVVETKRPLSDHKPVVAQLQFRVCAAEANLSRHPNALQRVRRK